MPRIPLKGPTVREGNGTGVAMRSVRPLTKGKEAQMRDDPMQTTTRQPRAMDPKPAPERRDLATELIRKARLATAIHLALQAEQRSDRKFTS